MKEKIVSFMLCFILLASICILIGGAIYLYVEVYKNANLEIDII